MREDSIVRVLTLPRDCDSSTGNIHACVSLTKLEYAVERPPSITASDGVDWTAPAAAPPGIIRSPSLFLFWMRSLRYCCSCSLDRRDCLFSIFLPNRRSSTYHDGRYELTACVLTCIIHHHHQLKANNTNTLHYDGWTTSAAAMPSSVWRYSRNLASKILSSTLAVASLRSMVSSPTLGS